MKNSGQSLEDRPLLFREADSRVVYPLGVEEIQQVLKLAGSRCQRVLWQTRDPAAEKSSGADQIINTGRMKKILEVNKISRYAVVEPGVTHRELTDHLEQRGIGLRHGLSAPDPDGPLLDTVLGTGEGSSFGALYGPAVDMVQGLEVVLPDGMVCKIGSCSVSSLWFARGPLPDLQGLFLNRRQPLGLITKLSLRLFAPGLKEQVIYILREPGLLPEVVEKITHPEMADRIQIIGKERPAYMKGVVVISLQLSGNTAKELFLKKEIFRNLFDHKKIIYKENLTRDMQEAIAETKGGKGIDGTVPLEKMPELWQRAVGIIRQNRSRYCLAFTVMDHGRLVSGTLAYTLPEEKRANFSGEERMQRELEAAVRESGSLNNRGMNEGSADLFRRIRRVIDPQAMLLPAESTDIKSF
ncbi:FAD-binding oxidoreductase [Desulforamulus ruminis]|uniref:FAD-binding oxidoreductase n=1 Tax=Desulforamulus ruminis TaxID=1564 RepID=UPI002FD99CF2